MTSPPTEPEGLKRFLPRIGSPGYHLLLATVAIFILGPLGGISAAFMNFSIGFYISGQVLAGILGSTVTFPYGPDGKHGANYIQTMAASVAGMCGMGVLMQAMVWMGLPEPPFWKLALYYLCIGMYGVGIGMLYTPILVDRMQLAYPSGYAVANILRALTDPKLLKRSVAKLGGGMLTGGGVGWFSLKFADLGLSAGVVKRVGALNISSSTFAAGAICGARIAIPALVLALIGWQLTPWLREHHWLGEKESFRRIGFIFSLGTIFGAAIIDITLILFQAWKRYRQQGGQSAQAAPDWKRVNMINLILWIAFWGAAIVVVGHLAMQQPLKYLLICVVLCFLFVLVNGISQGLTDWNPISSAFVATVFIMAAAGLTNPVIGMMCASIILIACSEGADMQQDRSTGWRLGTNRVVQFRYQVIGIVMGAVLAIVLAKLFMNAYPVLKVNQLTSPDMPGVDKWQSAMTLKFVGALKGLTEHKPYILVGMALGLGAGLITEIIRKLVKRSERWKAFAKKSVGGRVTDFLFDAVLVPSPYASSFGGFVELSIVWWWAAGGVAGSLYQTYEEKLRLRKPKPGAVEMPADMSTVSLVGGGMIAGEALASLAVGIFGLIASGALKKIFE
jgi:uncharacterized oligopeptide transporter (OPT) family protein